MSVGVRLPKAMGILEKARDKGGDNELIESEEKKDIAAMTRMLARAVAEATQEDFPVEDSNPPRENS